MTVYMIVSQASHLENEMREKQRIRHLERYKELQRDLKKHEEEEQVKKILALPSDYKKDE